MGKIKVSFDPQSYYSKPKDIEAAGISNKLGRSVIQLDGSNIRTFALDVSLDGHPFCPATFKESKRSKEHFEQQQLFALDFDNKDPNHAVTFEKVKSRADQYELPMLFAYDTLSSKNHDKFRVVFLNDNPVTDIRAAEMMLRGLTTIFPEADPSCKSAVQMYYGGKELLYFNDSLHVMNAESLIRNTVNCLENRYKANHYGRYVDKFYRETGVLMNGRKPSISVENENTESTNATLGKNLTNSTIHIPFGMKFPKKYLKVTFGEECTNELGDKKKTNFNRSYRSGVTEDISLGCQLFREFESGTLRLHHHELFGVSTVMVNVQKGEEKFREILRRHSYYEQEQRYQKWDQDLRRIKDYKPYACDGFCPYCDTCKHGANILSTVKPKYHQIEKVANFDNQLVEVEEAYEDFCHNFRLAVKSETRIWHVIRSQTAIGKTEAILQFLKATDISVLIVVPTNILKREVYERAKKIGITLTVSPSLHELKDDLPDAVWNEIQTLYDAGKSPMPYVNKRIRDDDLECAKLFRQYKDELEKFTNADGHAITTHRRLTSLDVGKYDLVIIDEDIIFSTVIPNRETVSLSTLKKLKMKLAPSDQLGAKIKGILKARKEDNYFTLGKIDYNKAYADIKMAINIPALCSATSFCFRSGTEFGNDMAEDSISFVLPVMFHENTKFIMLSATADKNICNYCFGKENVRFYNCKEARLAGRLNQYGDRPMSRAFVLEDTSVISRIKKWSGFEHTISFKKYKNLYSGELYFGNCVGCDYLKGENIDVIGTPHQPEWIYKLFAYSLGFDVDADLKPNTTVVHNGFRFRFSTYDDETLRAIQFYIIGSELEQAVGRARLLRCDCTVNLFSNFPLRQAVIKESVYDVN